MPVTPEFQPAYYFAAAGLAAALLAYLLLRRPRTPEEGPAAGSALAGFGEGIRLRDLFRVAVQMEEEGIAFYMKLGGRAQDPATQKLCAQLAEEESAHRQLFLDRLSRWRELPPNRLTWPALLEKVKAYGLFADAPADGATEDEMAAFAIRQEIKSAEFYRMFEPAFPNEWKREELETLVRQELAHAALLRAAYPRIR